MSQPAAHIDAFRPLDAVRALATTAIVLLHAATPYVRTDLPHLLWPIAERGQSLGPDLLFWGVRGFARGLLFLLAGYASAIVIAKVGPRQFVRKRLHRIGLPLLVGTLTVLPIMYVVWASGWVARGWALPKDLHHFRFHGRGIQSELFGFGHLWFLYYLLLTSLGFAAWHALTDRLALRDRLRLSDRVRAALALSPLRILMIAAPVTVVVALSPDSIFDFRNGFLPRLDFLAYHLPFFIVGVWMAQAKPDKPNKPKTRLPERRWALELWLALIVLLVAMPFIRRQSWGPLVTTDRWLLASLFGVYGGLMCSGLVGWGQSAQAPTGKAWRWLADHSFWIYLWHLPFVGLVQIAFYETHVAIAVKIGCGFAAGIAGAVWVQTRFGTRRGTGVPAPGR